MSLNHVRPWRNIYRRKSRQIHVGNVPIGGDAPIARADNDEHIDHRCRRHNRTGPSCR